ncbi:MAG: glycosyltransferase family 4 protein [Acidimicrobiales bacterium]|nr:glycosyltransferase family 4 protein [Acidimicrobiales bacterium]
MRLAVNAEQFLYRSPGGIGRYTAQLLTVLPGDFPVVEAVPFAARHPRAQVEAALADWGVAGDVRSRVVTQVLPRSGLYEGWVRFGWPPLRGLGPVDLVHAPSVAVPPRLACPLVVTVHDTAPELFPETFPARGRRFHRRGLRAAADRADLVIAVSQAAADEIVAHSPIPGSRVRVVPNGVAPMALAPARRAEVLARLGIAGQPYVLWLGSLEPRKGVGTLVSAMAELHRRGLHRQVRTVLGGFEGWLGAALVDGADEAELGSSLRRLGRLSEEEVWALYGGASVFAFPSRHEGFGLPVLEAMTQEVPVVASDIPALREVAGSAAVLVAPGDRSAWAEAIDGLLGDDSARRQLATAGLERSRMFDVHRAMAGTYAVYQEILSTGCGS